MKYGLPALVDADSEILILGTMPGERSIALQQYYGNRGNKFWTLLYRVFNEPLSDDYADRISFLKRHHIALWNVLAGCERDGSSDSKIRNELPNDFEGFHRRWPNIRQVFFESIAAQKYYIKYVGTIQGLTYRVLPSTSGLYAAMSFEEKLQAWQAINDKSIQ